MARLSPAELDAVMAPGRMAAGFYYYMVGSGYMQHSEGDQRAQLISDTTGAGRA